MKKLSVFHSALFVLVAASLAGPLRAHDDDPKVLWSQAPYAGPGWSRSAGSSVAGGGTAAAGGFDSSGIQLLSWLTVSDLDAGAGVNDCWGYTSPSGREYAIICSQTGTHFIEISSPSSPQIIGFIDGPDSLWRDPKVYAQHCYVVSEGGDGIQVVSMVNIDSGTVTLVNTVTTGGGSDTHNVAIDEESGFLYRCGGSSSDGLRIYDLSSPQNPTYVASWNTRYVHDAQIVTYTTGPYAGRQIAFLCGGFNGGYDQTGLEALDVTDKTNIFELDRVVYPAGEYSHQGWLSEDRQYFYLGDELDEATGFPTKTFVFDVSDLNNLLLVNTFTNGSQAIGHNLYTKNGLLFEANYRSGLRVFDYSNPTSPTEVAYFDTYPADDNLGYNGLWSVFPYFDSGVVIGSDKERGLFVWYLGQADVDFEVVGGVPDLIDPAGHTLDVRITGNITPGSESLHYNAGAGWQTVALTALGGGDYNGDFPALPCGTEVSWYLSATSSTSGLNYNFPSSAPGTPFASLAALGITTVVEYDMEGGAGWTGGVGGDDATTGIWIRVNPIGTAAQPEDDHTAIGTDAWVTGQGSVGGSLGENDVDGGTTTLLSPTVDLSAANDPVIGYWRWYSNDEGSNDDDTFHIDISFNGGSTWTSVETLGPGHPEASGGWYYHSLKVSDFGTPSSQVSMRFRASDLGSGSIVEAAIDDLRVFDVDCSDCGGSNYCVGAINSTGLGANIGATGSYAVPDDNFTLFADSCPAGQNGIFYYGPSQSQVAFGNGFRCVTGGIYRLPVVSTDSFGQVFFPIDFGSLPAGGQINPGSTWNFQFWYRDPAGGGAAFNLTNGLQAIFCP